MSLRNGHWLMYQMLGMMKHCRSLHNGLDYNRLNRLAQTKLEQITALETRL